MRGKRIICAGRHEIRECMNCRERNFHRPCFITVHKNNYA